MILTKQPHTKITEGYYPKSDTYVLLRFNFSGDTPVGEFRHLYMDTAQTFRTVSEFVYRLELLLERLNLPSSDFICRKEWDLRSYRKAGCGIARKPSPALLEKPSFSGIENPGEHFLLHIRYRQNATWQGDLRWINEKRTFAFRSTLELLMVLEGICMMHTPKEGQS